MAAYDLDAFETSAAEVAGLHAEERHVICYVDVGTAERFRPDDSSFPASVLGRSNDGEQAATLEPYFDGALTEQCNQYGECADFNGYLAAGKPVLNAEYHRQTKQFCNADDAAGIMGARYNLALNGATV